MRLSFCRVNSDYCDYLRSFDSRVPLNSDVKQRRPFIGILIEKDSEMKYFAPLSSPKPKHITMKNQIDFLKIKGGVWGAINFNNMIPVKEDNLIKVDLKFSPSDTKDEVDYKNLLINQLTWCNSNRENIVNKALKLYDTISHGKGSEQLSLRCCNFKLLEEKCLNYSEIQKALKEAAASKENPILKRRFLPQSRDIGSSYGREM